MHQREFAEFFGEVLRKHRKAKGYGQEQLAERAELASKMISLVERFERNPSLNVADSIARGLSVPLWRLVKEADELRSKEAVKK